MTLTYAQRRIVIPSTAALLALAACFETVAPRPDDSEEPPESDEEPAAEPSAPSARGDAGKSLRDAGPAVSKDASNLPPDRDASQSAPLPDAGTHDASRAGRDGAADATLATEDAGPAAPETRRAILLVGNSVSGTVSFLDAESFTNLGTVNVLPDRDEVLAAIQADVVRSVAYPVVKSQQLVHHFEPGEGDRFVDDVFLSPEGTTLYVSRSNLGDVAAFDLTKPNHPLKWKTWVSGFKADHATISPDGKQLVVSATSARVADVFEAANGKRIGGIATGYYPHQNDYSHDGKYIYNSSIGNVGYQAVPYELNALKGERWLVKADATTLEVVKTWMFEFGIRPSVITRDDKIMYAQLSYLNGVIKYDLEQAKEVARSDQPLSAFAMQTYKGYNEYPHDSAHHGLALSGDGALLCDCGTIDNTVSLVATDTMQVVATIDVGNVPYWATTSPDGRYCFVSLSGDNAISVVDFAMKKQITEVPVGKFPQRSRLGRVPEAVVGALSNRDG